MPSFFRTALYTFAFDSGSIAVSAAKIASVLIPLCAATVCALQGCGGDTPPPKTPAPVSATSGIPSSSVVADMHAVGAEPPSREAGPPLLDAAFSDSTELATTTDASWPSSSLDGGVTGDAGKACWASFRPTGNAVNDVQTLGQLCAAGMVQVIPPIKYVFKAGESRTLPIPFLPGCYRIIAVGGTSVTDVDLILKDGAGKIVAADMTPNDVFPMIHPNKEYCVDAAQLLNLNIVVKKGAGEVAGGVWKR
ncbi:MAG: hypothetical protein NVS3B20_05770 [Polyangiales bacterium]